MARSQRQQAGFFARHSNVLLYVPNIIGYARIAACLYSVAVAFTSPLLCILLYFAGFACDELDGRMARMLNQTSTLGAVLDMVTDRLATTGLLLILAMQYPAWYMACILLVFLDIFSHWFQMYATLLLGATTHKDAHSRSWLVAFYYSSRIFMGFCCVCVEVLYLTMYAVQFEQMRDFRIAGLVLRVPQAVLAQAPLVGELFNDKGASIMGLLLFAAIPGFTVKQICNWVQLQEATALLVDYERKRSI
jgi:CDP-diacylglycerol--inositol 3-phosphatidyltransferase